MWHIFIRRKIKLFKVQNVEKMRKDNYIKE